MHLFLELKCLLDYLYRLIRQFVTVIVNSVKFIQSLLFESFKITSDKHIALLNNVFEASVSR